MDAQTQKRELRRTVIARILALDPALRHLEEADLAARLADLPGFAAAGTVLMYATAFPEEIATGPLLAEALRRGKRLVCPRVDWPARRLRLHEVEDPRADLIRGRAGIPEPAPERPEVEPSAIDWVLVPGLAFDTRGFRLGRGAGHYDRLLPRLRPDAPRWALTLDAQWVEDLPVEPHDQPLDGIAGRRKTVLRARANPHDFPIF
ncbi:MAG TPA: 5-formyltetrahydrofolate cyclo-ligase [Isosphaeraceae bacterium]|jgi:5-formyltetrahydrofolate cyclo-ligase